MQGRAQEFLKFVTNQLGIWHTENFRGPPVYRSQGSIEGDSERHVIQRIDQLLEVALRTHNQLAQPIQLLFRGCDSRLILKALQNLLEFRNLALAPESIGGKQDGEQEESGRNCPQPVRKVFQLFPRQRRHRRRKQNEQAQRPSPQLALFAFQPV
jgi:hypothetical protein